MFNIWIGRWKNAYLCLGDAYLYTVEPFIPILVKEAQQGHMWCNTLNVFVIWYNRKQFDETERKQRLLRDATVVLEKEKMAYVDHRIDILDIDSLFQSSHTHGDK